MNSDTDHLAEYVRLLHQLHRLIVDGKGESDEAEEIRDHMDYPWRHLNAEELAFVDQLSVDLYRLSENRTGAIPEVTEQS